MRVCLLLMLLLLAAGARAAVGIDSSNFPNGIQSHSASGVITFGWQGTLETDNRQLRAASIVQNTSQSPATCGSLGFCQATTPPAPTQEPGSFPSTNGTQDVTLAYQQSGSLSGNGSNQYRHIQVGQEATLTINNGGQAFYINQLDLAYRSTLVLGSGDYWINDLNFGGSEVRVFIPAGNKVRLFVNTADTFNYHSRLNYRDLDTPGTPDQLFLYAYNDFRIDNQLETPAYIYSRGDFRLGHIATLRGAVTARNVTLDDSNAKVIFSSPAPVLACFNDSFERSSLGSEWVTTRRSGSFDPGIVSSSRLRLTNDSSNVATAVTLQRLFPAASNLVEIEFTYYAYSNSSSRGADGVAVILSDSAYTPQPGSFGGSLGYAQRDNGDAGFAGGWLGVGLDEYGNFSQANEGRVGGIEFRPDAVAIRGSYPNYRYLQGTATLSPGVDSSTSSTNPAPGHRYRIRIDSRLAGQALVSVERNTGSGFQSLVAPFNALTESGQATIPTNFWLSFTGSTGGSVNNHDLDDLQVCALQMNPVGTQIDHFEFVYSSPALTCSPQPVTIKACLNSNCSSLYTDPVSVVLSPSSGWTATLPATISGNTLSFVGGTASVQLRSSSVGDVTLGVTSSVPATKPLSTLVCSTSGCKISYADSGFLISVPNMIAAKPVTASIKAVKKSDTTQACVPGFASVTRSLSFTSAYSNPTLAASTAAGVTVNQPVVVNGSNITGSATSLSLVFDANGSAPLAVRYDDAGLMTLSAAYAGSVANGDSGLSMNGSTTFKSRPYGLCLQTDSTCTVAGVNSNCPPFPGGIRAGDSFPLRIRAVGWQADGEALTAAALCAGNIVTPKFALDGIALSSVLAEPATGVAGTVSPQLYNHALGNQTTASVALSEVGVFRLSATPAAGTYLGSETVSGGSSDLVGRMIPASLAVVGSAALTPSCGTGFSYQGQPMYFATLPNLTITGKNRQGGTTTNYDIDPFWRLPTPSRVDVAGAAADDYSSTTGKASLDAAGRLLRSGAMDTTSSGDNDKDGARTYTWRGSAQPDGSYKGESLTYVAPLLPLAGATDNDYPFAASLRLDFPLATLRDSDLACYGGTTCAGYSLAFGGSEVRLGRLRIGNAHGSELQSLSLPVTLESWQNVAGGSFQNETLDTCTTADVLGAVALDGYTDNLAVGETTASSTPPAAGVGVGSLLLSAPGSGNDGSVQARYSTLPSWLYFTWDGATRSGARGLATFGIYQGAAPLIYRREMYRQ